MTETWILGLSVHVWSSLFVFSLCITQSLSELIVQPPVSTHSCSSALENINPIIYLSRSSHLQHITCTTLGTTGRLHSSLVHSFVLLPSTSRSVTYQRILHIYITYRHLNYQASAARLAPSKFLLPLSTTLDICHLTGPSPFIQSSCHSKCPPSYTLHP